MTRFLAAPLLVLALPLAAAAHAVGIEAKMKGGAVSVEVFFDDDTPAAGAAVTVEDAGGAAVAAGKADERGVWSFPAPKAGKYTVRANAGDGHTAKTTITVPAPAPLPTPALPTPAPPTAPATDTEPVSVSDGPSRESFTGAGRWARAGAGVALIAGATGLIVFVSRARQPRVRA